MLTPCKEFLERHEELTVVFSNAVFDNLLSGGGKKITVIIYLS